MQSYSIHKVGSNKGAPRLYLEGATTSRAGFNPGKRYEVEISLEKKMVALRLKETGNRVVSSKEKKGVEVPVIDLNSQQLLSMFEGMDAVRVVMRNAEIFIMPLASAVRKKQRISDYLAKVQNNEPITVGSLSHGVGVLTHALHAGLTSAGMKSKLSFALEIRPELLDQAIATNDAWDMDTQYIAAPLQEFAFDVYAMAHLPQVTVLEMGLPCSGASVAGRAKLKTAHAEAHPEVGHLIAAAIAVIMRVNPLAIVFENVVPYQSSASMSILRNHLSDMGYACHETILEGTEFNVLENRKRMCMVAVTEGVEFDFDALNKPDKQERHLGEILEDIPDDDPRWSKMEGLKAKEIRDKEKGNNFNMQVFNKASSHIGTITKGYSKIRSSDPKIGSETNPDMLRQLTVSEHARVKDIPVHLVDGLSNTIAHESLGQSVLYTPFVAVGKLLGESLKLFGVGSFKPIAPQVNQLSLLMAA